MAVIHFIALSSVQKALYKHFRCWPSFNHFNEHIKTAEQRTLQQYDDWYTGRWWVSCNICHSEEGPGRPAAPLSPLLAVPNVTANVPTFDVAL